jgi:sucrose synthase
VLELDFEPFNASFPRPSLSKSIGNGVQFLNRHLSSKLFHDKESLYPLLNFLRAHNYKGMVCAFVLVDSLIYFMKSIFFSETLFGTNALHSLQTMMLNDRIRSLSALQAALRKAEEHLATLSAETPYSEFQHR